MVLNHAVLPPYFTEEDTDRFREWLKPQVGGYHVTLGIHRTKHRHPKAPSTYPT